MQQQVRELLLILVLGLPLAVGIAGLGGYVLASRALTPIEQMTARARTITAERLAERLPVDNPNENSADWPPCSTRPWLASNSRSIRCAGSPPTPRTSCERR